MAVVTGASGTLCSIFAKALARAGAKVALLGRNMEKLKELADAIEPEGGIARGYTCNVMNKANCLQVAEDVLADLEPIDNLVNGAGGINDGETFRFGGGQFKIAAAQAFVKRNVDIFKPQFYNGNCLRLLEAALQTDARVDVEQKRQVGLKIAGDNFI